MLLGSSIVSAFLVAVLCVFIERQGREETRQGRKDKKKNPKYPVLVLLEGQKAKLPNCVNGEGLAEISAFLDTNLSRNCPQFWVCLLPAGILVLF